VIYQSIIQSINHNQSINQLISRLFAQKHIWWQWKKAHGWAEQWTAYCT